MNFNLVTEAPLWWILVCLAGGFAYAFVLYKGDHSFDPVHKWLRRFLFVLRATLVTLLALLLLTPLIKTITREKEKPLIIIAQDDSESLIAGKDSTWYRETYSAEVKKLAEDLSEKFDVKTISWGDRVTEGMDFGFDQKQTDFSVLFRQLDSRYGNRNVGAVIVASDGLYNRGSSPIYSSTELKVPFYTIALGDTTIQKDVRIARVNFNKTAFLGNTFPLEIHVGARQAGGSRTTLSVIRDSSVLFSREITVSGNSFSQVVPVVLDANKKGMNQLTIRLSEVAGEMSTQNNERIVYVEVIENRQKILVVANAPHPDLSAIRQTVETSDNYEIKVTGVENFNGNVRDYNLVILHNLPSDKNPANEIFTALRTESVPALYITGLQTSFRLFNQLKTGVEINSSGDRSNPVQAVINRTFTRFTLTDEMRNAIPAFPPLLAPFGQFRSTADNAILLYQQIGNVVTDDPLQVFNESGEARTGIICGEGLWRWRMSDYSQHGNFNAFNDWLLKTIQNLSVRESKTHFRVIAKNNFSENEPVTFDAEVYNDNYELINTVDVNLVITNPEKKKYQYTFSKTERAYTLNAGNLPAGNYSYQATVNLSGKLYTENGEFSISALQAERGETVADHDLMYALAERSGGEMFYPAGIADLEKSLLSREDIKTITYSNYSLKDLVDLKLLFFVLLFLLSLEWFLRKRAGSY